MISNNILPAKSKSDVMFCLQSYGTYLYDRINTQLIYRIAVAQVVTRRITKPQRTFLGSNLTGYSFLFIFFKFGGGRGEGEGGWRSDFIILSMSFFYYLYFYYYFLFFIPLTCIRYIYKKKTSVTTQATVKSEIHANVSVKRHICDVKICD